MDPLNGKVIARNIANGLERVDRQTNHSMKATLPHSLKRSMTK
jgi:hypothetical protein